ncbi:MAG TPA: PEP/pyruvate-binding domain-containing protein [Acidobacteriota bacterium]|nr:PEP/pyruvate-binding domain-containing protein [Acidobacteriota bacterium]
MDALKGPIEESLSPRLNAEPRTSPRKLSNVEALIQSLTSEFDLVMGRPERVAALCSLLAQELQALSWAEKCETLSRLLPLLHSQSGARASTLFALLESELQEAEDPWPLLSGMLTARDQNLALRALDLTGSRVAEQSLQVNREVALFLAEQVETEHSPLAEHSSLNRIASILVCLTSLGRSEPTSNIDLFLNEGDRRLRRLAARLLDLGGQLPSPTLAAELLGRDSYEFLRPYLDYTRATHLDLLRIACDSQAPPVVSSLRKAEAVCGKVLLREVIAEMGWARVNLGLEVRQYTGISVGGSLPLTALPFEVPMLEGCKEARRVFENYLFIVHGGEPGESTGESAGGDPVAHFRAYNLAHAEALRDILDLAPLTSEKVRRILRRMDRIVEDFVVLFTAHTDEARILPGIYRELRERIVHELNSEAVQPQLSAELTRLVQMFEDPLSLGGVRTLHGLKRYLHQRGLRLGMRLVQAGRSTNRTVDVAVASHRRLIRTTNTIHYVDFEPETGEGETRAAISYPVAALADALGHQLLYGQESFPSVNVFCYGNEVHYYLSYKNHPALLRIDFSPPLQGGMIDLEYFGVSKYELSLHPNPALEAVRLLFRRLEFDVQIDTTRIHARYDKERAVDLDDLCRKAEALFALVPYLMDVDWIIGGLNLGSEARRSVAEAWAERFALWHVLPLSQILTKDRQSILTGVEAGPTGEHELAWSGEGFYMDRFTTAVPADLLEQLQFTTDDLGLDLAIAGEVKDFKTMGQVRLEQCFLGPIREAVAHGELLALPEGLRRRSPSLFRREHEAVRLAAILDSSDEFLNSAGDLARQIAPFERFVRFRSTGTVDGYEVQRARLSLGGECLGIYALRDQGGIIRLALFSRGEGLWQVRNDPGSPWVPNFSCDAASLARALRRANWPMESTPPPAEREAAKIRQHFRGEIEVRHPAPLQGERIVVGLKASPGRAVGPALFGKTGRSPKDFDGAVLIAPAVRPEDNTFLYHAAGIVSTGGGVLSHAGLIAIQFHKPALIISGQWQQTADSSSVLLYRTLEFKEEQLVLQGRHISLRRQMREREYELREGDLVVLDANEGVLRVLGQERMTIALHEGFQLLDDTSRRLGHATDSKEILYLRGRRLRARHQIEKSLAKLADPVLAVHVVDEILLGRIVEDADAGQGKRAGLLSLILANSSVGELARRHLLQISCAMEQRYRRLVGKALEGIPASRSIYEILAMRLDVHRLRRSLRETAGALQQCGLREFRPPGLDVDRLEASVRLRLMELRTELVRAGGRMPATSPDTFQSRQLLLQIGRIDALLKHGNVAACGGLPASQLNGPPAAAAMKRFVLGSGECGLDVFPLIGWKAANLAEAERIGGPGLVPPWFVVTDKGFEELLEEPLDKTAAGREGIPPSALNLREAIGAIAARRDVDNALKSAQIRWLWEKVTLPPGLTEEVLASYRQLADDAPTVKDHARPFVAIRSSAREEDAERAARAGEFETFLFVRGEKALLDHLKRAWSGLWTERALHNRAILGTGWEKTGGGIIVQRIACSRVSGVLQTVNIAEGEVREMVINAGLGLGEGIVSGVVAADHVVVDKESNLETGPLRFRYVTADKRSRVVFNKRREMGTMLEETLYHQRLRPALEYVELAELVRTAASLEAAYGFPLDIEFGIEGTKLWILQVRPVATFVSVLKETIEHYPLR